MFAVPNMAVFCSSLTSCFPGTLLTYFLNDIIIIIIIIIIITAIEFSPDDSPYTSTDKTNNKIYINETVQKHSTNNTKRSKYKYTYYQTSHTITKTPTPFN